MTGYQRFVTAYDSGNQFAIKRSLRDKRIDEKQIDKITEYLVNKNPIPGFELCCKLKYFRGCRWLAHIYMNYDICYYQHYVSELLISCSLTGYTDVTCWILNTYKPNDYDINEGFKEACRSGHIETAIFLYKYSEQLESKRPAFQLFGEFQDLEINECFKLCCKSENPKSLDIGRWLCSLEDDMDYNQGFEDLCRYGKQHMIPIIESLYRLTNEQLDIYKCFKECWKNPYIGLYISKLIYRANPYISFTTRMFYDCCQYNDLQACKWMLEVSDVKIDFVTAFLASCSNHDIEIAKHILDVSYIDINFVAYKGFKIGCNSANLAICKWLYKTVYFDPFAYDGKAVKQGLGLQGLDEFRNWLLELSQSTLYTQQSIWNLLLLWEHDIRYVVYYFIKHNCMIDLNQIVNHELRAKLEKEIEYFGNIEDCLSIYMDKETVSCIQNFAL